jgi:two-component system chemotaxis response regulator CheB
VSHLAEILQRRSVLKVQVAEEGSVLAPGNVYIAPPGKHTLLRTDGTLSLVVSGTYPPSRPSADLLLVSLAISAGTRAVAVVLSGHGTDGATGATAVHDFGGVVIAADEASSQEFAMPQATIGRKDAADHVVHVDEIAGLLQEIVGRDSRG